MSTVNETCSICLDNFDPAERYLEGHQSQVFHAFDPSCIRNALSIQSRCPLCRCGLRSNQLIQVPNPHFSWVARACKWVNNVRKTLPSRTQTVSFVKKNWKQIAAVAAGSMLIKDIINETVLRINSFVSGAAIGSGAILFSGLVVALPMICNKITNQRMVNQKTINKIFFSSIVSSALLVGVAKIQNVSKVVGVIAGATLTAFAARIIGESSVFYEEGAFQIGPLSNDFTTSDYVIGQSTEIAALFVGAITAGKLFSYYTEDCAALIQTVSTLFGGILGTASIFAGEIICAGVHLIVQFRRNNY